MLLSVGMGRPLYHRLDLGRVVLNLSLLYHKTGVAVSVVGMVEFKQCE